MGQENRALWLKNNIWGLMNQIKQNLLTLWILGVANKKALYNWDLLSLISIIISIHFGIWWAKNETIIASLLSV